MINAIIYAILLGCGLAMDASAVSMTNGMNETKMKLPKMILVAAMFGIFQCIMPLCGYFVGNIFKSFLEKFTAIIALLLLSYIGGKMLYEGIKAIREQKKSAKESVNEEENVELAEKKKLTFGQLFIQAIATSIDALTVGLVFIGVGVSYGLDNNFFAILVSLIIGVVTFIFSIISLFIGKKFGELLSDKAQIVGGLILIGIGLKTFIQFIISIF
ncbi:MAG: manganese efflux pump MntP family protein [Bacilli bacterium]